MPAQFASWCAALRNYGTVSLADVLGPAIDLAEGGYPMYTALRNGIHKVAERFRPEAFYGNPTGRETFMVVNLDTPAQIAELMYVLTWFTGGEPTFTPIMRPEIYGEAIANAKKIIAPPK